MSSIAHVENRFADYFLFIVHVRVFLPLESLFNPPQAIGIIYCIGILHTNLKKYSG